jgi:hypothetical protein
MKSSTIITLLLTAIMVSNCKRDAKITQPTPEPCCVMTPVDVVKFKTDSFRLYVMIGYSAATSSLTSFSDTSILNSHVDTNKIFTRLINDYWIYNGGTGMAVTSVKITDYAYYYGHSQNLVSFLQSKIICASPFIEYYDCANLAGKDTAKLNNLIRTNKLNQCIH